MDADSPQHVLPFPTLAIDTERVDADQAAPVRGVRWVLTWAAALAVLGWAAVILSSFACQLVAEQRLSDAAAAGRREAICQRATYRTVEQTIRRRLVDRGFRGQDVSVALQWNGAPVSGVVRPAAAGTRRRPTPPGAGSRLSVSLSVPIESVLPSWLQPILVLGQDATITVWADHQLADI